MMLEIVYLQQTYIFIWTNNRGKIDVGFFVKGEANIGISY